MLLRFREFIDNLLYRLGYIPEKELILRTLPGEKQKRAREIVRSLNELKTLANIADCYSLSSELSGILRDAVPELKSEKANNAVRFVGGDANGYRPAMARLYGLFSNNPFGIYAFIARHHWAVRAAIQVIRDELCNDGYELRAKKGTTPKRLRDVYRKLKELNIPQMRIDIASHLKLYGNAWILPHRNLLGQPGMLELLAPPKLMPVFDPKTDKIIGWEYTVGINTFTYRTNQLFHLYAYSVDGYKQIGDPPLAPAILTVEADLAADSFNNQIFQKGGMMGIILNMKDPPQDVIAKPDNSSVQAMQDMIDAQFSGVKAGGSVLVTRGVDRAFTVKLPDVSAFEILHMECAKTVANCLGVPPEKIAVSRSATLQYIPSLVEDSVNAQFDKSLHSLIDLVDEFLNERILRDLLGITDIRIVASGRFGSLTKNAAETIKTLADAGPLITVNEALERVLGWERLPADNPRGNLVLDNSVNRELETKPQTVDPEIEDPNLGKISSKEFFEWIEQTMLVGGFEMHELSADAEDNVLVDVAIIKHGEMRLYANNGRKVFKERKARKLQKKNKKERPEEENGSGGDCAIKSS